MNEIQVTLRGNVATEPRQIQFDDGNIMTSFRLASTSRRFDPGLREWVDRGTVYVNVNCRKSIAANAAISVHKGHPLVVTGRLRERYWSANGGSGRALEVDADGLGHDLRYGTTEFTRIVRTERAKSPDDQAGDEMAYQLAKPEDSQEPDPIDVSGMPVLGDENLDPSDPEGPAAADDLDRGVSEDGPSDSAHPAEESRWRDPVRA